MLEFDISSINGSIKAGHKTGAAFPEENQGSGIRWEGAGAAQSHPAIPLCGKRGKKNVKIWNFSRKNPLWTHIPGGIPGIEPREFLMDF